MCKSNVPEILFCPSCGHLMEIPAQHWSVHNSELVLANKAICNDCAWEQMAENDTSHSIFE